MKANMKKLMSTFAVVAMMVMCCPMLAFAAEETAEYVPSMYATIWALVPAFVAIILALITKEVYSSLFLGILVGGIFYSGFNFEGTINHVFQNGFIGVLSDSYNVGILIFLVILGAMVSMMNRAGGSAAFGRWAATHIKSRIGAQLATFALGIFIFIDDYFNCLTVGSVMLPVADSHKVSRAKLSYLIDATAAPICMIAPISSWAAAVASYTEGTGLDGIDLFIKAIPYNFYSLLTFVFIIALVISKRDYGPMARHERNALEKSDLFSTEERVEGMEVSSNPKGRVPDLLLPILVLIGISVYALIYNGGFFGDDPAYAGRFADAFSNTDATVGLPWGAIVALILIVIYLICRKLITFKEAMECVPKGFIAMVPAITILTMATALKNISNDLLGSATYVESLMKGAAPGLENFLPAVIFLVACLLAFATGTSWGTFGILIPIVCYIFDPSDPIFYIGMSACLAGAVCGDHCSPISDTTIMSSAGAQCVHVNHVSTQLPYAITVAVISFICFLIAGFVQNAVICLAIGTLLIVGFFAVLRLIKNPLDSEKKA